MKSTIPATPELIALALDLERSNIRHALRKLELIERIERDIINQLRADSPPAVFPNGRYGTKPGQL